MSDQEVGISGDVNFPVPAVDGRDSNGYLPGYRSGTKVRVQGSAHIVQGDKIMAVVYARNANRTRFEIGEKTVSSTDLTIDVSGSRLEQIRSTTADWDFSLRSIAAAPTSVIHRQCGCIWGVFSRMAPTGIAKSARDQAVTQPASSSFK
ncbi:hypothetical protein G3435_16960 [Pseudomonas sp. MAFF212428]|uniref:Uncharacterized protein n=1 Tax=Pseudomonas brassicae TaxID=2708063 RepID=A0A6M0CZ51_9PSED|nr:hypothetical protein [Pseudomonas brassicae]